METPPSAPFSESLLGSLPGDAPLSIREALSGGDVAAALDEALAAGDFALATDVLRIGWFTLLTAGGIRQRVPTLETLPGSQFLAQPLLALTLGLTYNNDRLRRAKALYYFGLAGAGVRAGGARVSPVERILVATGESVAFRLLGKSSLSIHSARTAVRLLETLRDERAALIGHLPRIYSQLGISLFYGGEEAEALHVLSMGYAESESADPSGFGSLALWLGIRALSGDVSEVLNHIEVARGELWTDEQRNAYPGTFYRIAEAILAMERLDVIEARRHLDSMEHDRHTIEHWTVIARTEALASLLAGDAAKALAELEHFVVLRGSEGASRTSRRRLASVRSVIHIALGNYDAAAAVLRDDAGNTPQRNVDRARLALVTDRPSDALRELRGIAGRTQSTRTRAEALTIEAAIGLRSGPSRRTDAVVSQLASTLRISGQRVALCLIPPDDLDAVLGALRNRGFEGLSPADSAIESPDRPTLTPREQTVLEALVRTTSLREIAGQLFVSTNTVKSQLRTLYRKLNASNREEALAAAIHRHLISASEDEP